MRYRVLMRTWTPDDIDSDYNRKQISAEQRRLNGKKTSPTEEREERRGRGDRDRQRKRRKRKTDRKCNSTKSTCSMQFRDKLHSQSSPPSRQSPTAPRRGGNARLWLTQSCHQDILRQVWEERQ
ncbi:hypothetical protein NEOLEDRAFT_735559 [Neolentinus lepideus HHB14362 ss-1]|uniref:Uncharacterized protein n=1 Tax=Neolentinus lepideus HHB14362 ss-1 TaxID=1314782 RepID=A0A165PYV5_9AGAM|nr:hypothetical protein NEOLEDRAFT_735559 [Neolentinus lepideus HHB14362 ss-1]